MVIRQEIVMAKKTGDKVEESVLVEAFFDTTKLAESMAAMKVFWDAYYRLPYALRAVSKEIREGLDNGTIVIRDNQVWS